MWDANVKMDHQLTTVKHSTPDWAAHPHATLLHITGSKPPNAGRRTSGSLPPALNAAKPAKHALSAEAPIQLTADDASARITKAAGEIIARLRGDNYNWKASKAPPTVESAKLLELQNELLGLSNSLKQAPAFAAAKLKYQDMKRSQAHIVFDAPTHQYRDERWSDEESAKTTSVTTLQKQHWPYDQEAAINWATSKENRHFLYYDVHNREQALHFFDEMRNAGSAFHVAIDKYLSVWLSYLFEEGPEPDAASIHVLAEFRNESHFVLKTIVQKHWLVVASELRLSSRDHLLFGTVDAVFVDLSDGGIILVDWKRCGTLSDKDHGGGWLDPDMRQNPVENSKQIKVHKPDSQALTPIQPSLNLISQPIATHIPHA